MIQWNTIDRMSKSYLYNMNENRKVGIIVGTYIIEVFGNNSIRKNRLAIKNGRIYDKNGKQVAWMDENTHTIVDFDDKPIATTYYQEPYKKGEKNYNEKDINDDKDVIIIFESFKDYIFTNQSIKDNNKKNVRNRHPEDISTKKLIDLINHLD